MTGERNRRARGQAMVEFALVAPILVMVLFLIMEAGRFVFQYHVMSNATREGARYAIVHGSNSFCPSGPMPGGNWCDPPGNNVKDAVRDAAYSLTPANLVVADPDWEPENNDRGSSVTVAATYNYQPLLPLLPPITVTTESTLVINN